MEKPRLHLRESVCFSCSGSGDDRYTQGDACHTCGGVGVFPYYREQWKSEWEERERKRLQPARERRDLDFAWRCAALLSRPCVCNFTGAGKGDSYYGHRFGRTDDEAVARAITDWPRNVGRSAWLQRLEDCAERGEEGWAGDGGKASPFEVGRRLADEGHRIALLRWPDERSVVAGMLTPMFVAGESYTAWDGI